jgi:hypothetical protein
LNFVVDISQNAVMHVKGAFSGDYGAGFLRGDEFEAKFTGDICFLET